MESIFGAMPISLVIPESPDAYEQSPTGPTSRELSVMKALCILTWIFGGIVFFFGVFNCYNYLYKQEKYKMVSNCFLYAAAFMSVILDIAFAQMVPLYDYCEIWWFLTSYGAAYCNLIVGVCQAYQLSTLKNQLNCLFVFQKIMMENQSSNHESMLLSYVKNVSPHQALTSRQTHLKIYRKRMRIFKCLFVTAIVFIGLFFTTHLTLVAIVEKDADLSQCQADSYLQKGTGLTIELSYHIIRGIFLLLLNAWLISITFMTISLIRRKRSGSSQFTREIVGIAIAYWTFAVCYAGWLCLYIYEFFSYEFEKGNNGHSGGSGSVTAFRDQIQTVAYSGIAFNIVPILTLFLIHFFSYTSVANIFNIVRLD